MRVHEAFSNDYSDDYVFNVDTIFFLDLFLITLFYLIWSSCPHECVNVIQLMSCGISMKC